MNFDEAVSSTPEIAEYLKRGLQALRRGDSQKINVSSTRDLKGSVDIDTCLKNRYPSESRWDYVFGYKDRVCFVEFHQAKASEVKRVVEKVKWLKRWRKTTKLEALKERSSYYWVSTQRTDPLLRKGGKYRRMLDQNGIQGPSSALKADAVL